MDWLFPAVIALIVAGIVYGTIFKTRWGVNFGPVSCPQCGTEAPRMRKPANPKQAMWGGWTCPQCGTEVDKWGRRLPG